MNRILLFAFFLSISHLNLAQYPLPILRAKKSTPVVNAQGEVVFTLPPFHTPQRNNEPNHKKLFEIFYDDIGVVESKEGFYWINKKGEKIKDFGKEYVYISAFSEGLARAQLWKSPDKERSKCFLNKDGQRAFGSQLYYDIWPFKNGLAPVQFKNKEWAFINKKNEVVLRVEGFDKNNIQYISSFSDGVAYVKLRKLDSLHNARYFWINDKGEKVLWVGEQFPQKQIMSVSRFKEGLLQVRLKNGTTKIGSTVFLNRSGEIVFEVENAKTCTDFLGDQCFCLVETDPSRRNSPTKLMVYNKIGGSDEIDLPEGIQGTRMERVGEYTHLILQNKSRKKSSAILQRNPAKITWSDKFIVNMEERFVLLFDKDKRYTLQEIDGRVIWESPVSDWYFYSMDEAKKYNAEEIGKFISRDSNDLYQGLLDFKNLEELKLSSFATLLPDEIGNLKKLKILNINMMSLKALPKSIIQLKNLEYLRVESLMADDESVKYLLENMPWLKNVHLVDIYLDREFKKKLKTINPKLRLKTEDTTKIDSGFD